MPGTDSPPVVVGIDGSKAAVRAALWAADEAMSADTTLLLVSVVDPGREDQQLAMDEARNALAGAWEAVADTGEAVKVDTEILHGDPAKRLLNVAQGARMLCVGHKGVHDSTSGGRGATASHVASRSGNTVVVVRHRKEPSPFHQWVIAVVDESADSRLVLRSAMAQASLRQAPLLALTSWSTTGRHRGAKGVRRTLDRYLDRPERGPVQVCALSMPDDLLDFLQQCVSIDQLVVVGSSKRELVNQLTSARAAKILRNSNASVMIVRPGASA